MYRCGFATTQAAYEDAERTLHAALEEVEAALSAAPFLCGGVATEADLRLLPTVQRFDPVYASLFRCGRRRIAHDYPAIREWRARMLSAHVPGHALQLQVRREGFEVDVRTCLSLPLNEVPPRWMACACLGRPAPEAAPSLGPPTPLPTLLSPPFPCHQAQDCFDLADAARSYYAQLFPLNPSGIVPVLEGPAESEARAGEDERLAPVPITEMFEVHPQRAVAAR